MSDPNDDRDPAAEPEDHTGDLELHPEDADAVKGGYRGRYQLKLGEANSQLSTSQGGSASP